MRVIPKLILIILLLALLPGCPDPVTGKVDPYKTADNAFAIARSSLGLADAAFEQVVVYIGLTGDKLAAVRLEYQTHRKTVKDLIDAAYEAYQIAVKNKEEVNVASILADSDKAWTTLRTFIASLMDSIGAVSGPQSTGAAVKTPPDLDKMLPRVLYK